jgi:hypothetical protein
MPPLLYISSTKRRTRALFSADERAIALEATLVEVHILPLQAEQLTGPHPGLRLVNAMAV